MSKPEYQHHDEIWLQPWCRECEANGDDRLWAPDDAWADEPCDCGAKSVRYTLATPKTDAAEDMYAALAAIEAALRKDARDKSIMKDTVEYHLDGQSMYQAINRARTALAKAEGRDND